MKYTITLQETALKGLCSLDLTTVDPLVHDDYFQVSKLFTIKDLLNAGVHFGHHEGCWNPYMKPYLFGSRERYHIFDLDKTAEHLTVSRDKHVQVLLYGY